MDMKYIGAALAVLTGLGSGIGEGYICAKAMEGMEEILKCIQNYVQV